jgi:hypothetical protein
MAAVELTPEQEADAQELVRLMEEVSHTKILEAARLLASKPTKDLFGQTEFVIRDLVLQIAAQAYEQFLRQKKMATREPA